jgi:L-ascorbate metabolism protein UlaG (beta-lactamase superfamily)
MDNMAGRGRMAITWYGHSTFVITTPGGKRVVLDPWLEQNPMCPPHMKRITEADLILVTHGHSDHMGDIVPVSRATGAPIVTVHELGHWMERKGLHHVNAMGLGGTLAIAGLRVTVVPAVHSSSIMEKDVMTECVGEAAGFVVRMEDGRAFYFAGDTTVFGDMRLIAEMYAPEIAFLPIGDYYTMGPDGAALATRLLGVKQVVPMHYDTFPLLTGTVAEYRRLVEPLGIDILEMKPGDTAT